MLIVLMQPQHSARASQILPCVLDHFLALVAATNAKEILLKDCSLEGAKTYFWLVQCATGFHPGQIAPPSTNRALF